MKQNKKRLRILSDSEINALYQLPNFTQLERSHFFSLSDTERLHMNKLPLASAVYFIASLGYFKAKHQMFTFSFPTISTDAKFIVNTYFAGNNVTIKIPSANTRTSIKSKILSLYGYTVANKETKKLLNRARYLARWHSDPVVLFRELIDFLEQKKMVLPAYSVMQDIVGLVLGDEEERLKQIVASFLPGKIRLEVNNLLNDENVFYNMSELKLDLKNFKCRQMTAEIKKQEQTINIYKCAKKNLSKLKVSEQNIHYYASLIFYYTPRTLRIMSNDVAALYVLCYIYHRHQKINDNITQAFMFLVSQHIANANEFATSKISSEKQEIGVENEKIGILLGNYIDESMFNMVFSDVVKKAYDILPKEQIMKIKKHFAEKEGRRDKLKWDYYSSKSHSISINIRPLFLAMEIQSDKSKNIALMESMNFLKGLLTQTNHLQNTPSKQFPKKILPPATKKYIMDESGKINPNKYEFFLYDKISSYIKNHKIYLNNTLQFKSFDEDTKATENWDKAHKSILKKIDKPKLSASITNRLAELKESLENLYIGVNQRIESGENHHITIEKKDNKRTWRLSYPKEERGDNDYDHRYFKHLSPRSITDIFDFVDDRCNFMSKITHIKPRHSKSTFDNVHVKADIVANGTRQGRYQMSKHSNLDFQALCNTDHNFIRLDTIMSACNVILTKMVKLPAFQRCGPQHNINHASIDGSKQGTVLQTSKARYSPKYFGLGKGVSVLGMILNNASINGNVIGANEHESHYLYDLYHNMGLDIEIDMLSTDTAGSNQVNFAIFDLANSIQFAPHYKSIATQVNRLSGFQSLHKYSNMLIKPSKQIRSNDIVNGWPSVQRILAALFMKETTQSIVVRKLCSHGNQSETKKSLWEYNNILFSLHILRCIDDPILRRSARIVLNRGEGYNKLYNAIAKIGGKKFRGLSELEISIWHQCTRLITLIIVFYNMSLLSELITKYSKLGDHEKVKVIEKISPLATSHIILGGFYTYTNETQPIDFEGLISSLEKIIIGSSK